MESVGIVFLLAIGGFIAIVFLLGKNKDMSTRSAFSSVENFNPQFVFGGALGGRGVGIDTASQRFAFTDIGSPRVFDFDQLVAVEIVKDGVSIQRTNRSSQVAGAAVGGVLLGPAGLLVGALTGSKVSESKISRLALKVFVTDLHLPVIEVVFLDTPKGLTAEQVKILVDELDVWHGRFNAILHGRS